MVKGMVFLGIMYACENWAVKKAKCGRVSDFELWCWRRFWEFLGLQGDPTSSS